MHQLRQYVVVRPCRLISHRRYPTPVASRRFHLSPQWMSTPPHDPHDDSSVPSDAIDDSQSPNIEDKSTINGSSPSLKGQPSKSVSRPYGSALRRAMRNRQSEQPQNTQKDRTTKTIPEWFSDQNLVIHDSESAVQIKQLQITKSKRMPDQTNPEPKEVFASAGREDPSVSDGPTDPKDPQEELDYAVPEEIWSELLASVKAGLRLPPVQYAEEPVARKSHLVLQYPGNDGIPFLDAVVRQVSKDLKTDLITLNAQDIAQLFSEYDLAETGSCSPVHSLGYEVHQPVATLPEPIHMEGEGVATAGPGMRTEVSNPSFITIESGKDSGDIPLRNLSGLKSLLASLNAQENQDPAAKHVGPRADRRWIRLWHEILSSLGRAPNPNHNPNSKDAEESAELDIAFPVLPRDTIVHIQDYRDIQNAQEGYRVIDFLQKVINERRRDGSRIIFIGSISEEPRHSSSQDGAKVMQNQLEDNFSKTLIVTPSMGWNALEKRFAQDKKIRTMDINIRNLQTMLRFRLNETSSPVKDDIFSHRAWRLDPLLIKRSGIRENFWSYNHVHWLATLAIGSIEPGETFGIEHLRRGFELMDKGDRVTNDWLHDNSPKKTDSRYGESRERLLASLRKTCTAHEKKFLNGVVDAKSIRTTFDDVHVSPETIDALKTLTSLSLIRPEAFTYGVLATEKITGLLLYGPPGTGKTLLAKAVARESGATVLEVSGSDVYDMYVGEGEKNIKAIFTLAKKLSPCIVFVDEGDAIFGSRISNSSSRTSHRELINQFLREWDGLNAVSAFIMVATNRPFDLDDAVLRRLPRRLLVDLPNEQERLAILKIHLKEEQLEPTVDLAELAKRTDLYSGSDLKNLSVAAALACVREEHDAAVKHQGEEPYQYPARRTLTFAHFEKGMEEISASISEDMPSVAAIRKFDEQFGDRRGRRVKPKGWGFGPVSDGSKTEGVRVRD
ncbi:uncharacterized protein N7483_008400 [Penicillium malachiteum]|uniref:uncharacterized protein n=1 Tax=Penicillium malachiteum TaxID=1324776 RepID=UPI002546E827|nr:uncharacterized protein N7483_008400 [Penicillium malachiteum]KAJ5720466.1 hypothetical protein N7483_008400 [Penicillium malachiteum]